jgi:cell division protein FtsI (penicillin-binding protein 3)
MVTMSFGYAIEVSPLQTLTLYNAIANDGKMMRPYLVNSIQNNGIVTKQFEPKVIADKICTPEVIKMAKECMESVVTEGTGKLPFKDMAFQVAGKTGTAHVADGNLKYTDGVYQATFVGYFPAKQPVYTCIVLIRSKPHAAVHYGGTLAGPVFRDIATRLYAMNIEKKTYTTYIPVKDSAAYFYAGYSSDIINVYKTLHVDYADSVSQSNWASMYASGREPMLRSNTIHKQVMPNVKGMGLKDAVYLLENMGLKVQVKGRGKVMNQSIAPGSALAKSNTVMLELAS